MLYSPCQEEAQHHTPNHNQQPNTYEKTTKKCFFIVLHITETSKNPLFNAKFSLM